MRGPARRAVLGHVADEHDRGAALVRPGAQPRRRLADLAHRPGGPLEPVVGQRLDRVDDRAAGARARPPPRGCRRDPWTASTWTASPAGPATKPSRSARRCSCSADSSPVAYSTGPVGVRLAKDAGGGLQHERGLADARLAAEQHQRARHQATAQDPVDLTEPHRQPADRRRRDLTQRHGVGAPSDAAAGPRRPARPSRGADAGWSRRASPTHHSGGTGPPSGRCWRRRPGRRTGSPAAPRGVRPRRGSSRAAARWSARHPATGRRGSSGRP